MKLYAFTRFWVGLTVVLVRMAPLVVAAVIGTQRPLTGTAWGIAFATTLLLQPLFYWVERRCASDGMSHWRGMVLVGAAMNTGWTYLDIVFVTAGVVLAYLLSCIVALMPRSSARFLGLLRGFQRNRMEQ
jgi:hypothetical protein